MMSDGLGQGKGVCETSTSGYGEDVGFGTNTASPIDSSLASILGVTVAVGRGVSSVISKLAINP